MALSSCSIGEIERSECHKTTYTHGKCELSQITQLSKENVELLVWRTGIRKNKLKTVCLSHQKVYLDKFTLLNPFCCDPFNRHNKENSKCKG